ncbi:hypothetical protein R1flu_027271 [Riccia fluitans]|uniref:Uncharacterized protein n=1 Tax=Riccia fluitans TaxID=41844 RepID=A0ABD1XME1_9MARC
MRMSREAEVAVTWHLRSGSPDVQGRGVNCACNVASTAKVEVATWQEVARETRRRIARSQSRVWIGSVPHLWSTGHGYQILAARLPTRPSRVPIIPQTLVRAALMG